LSKLVIIVCFSVTLRDAQSAGSLLPCSMESTGAELSFHHSIIGKFVVDEI